MCMKKLMCFIPVLMLIMVVGCDSDIEIPVSTDPPIISLTADTIAVANGKYILKAEGQSAYGGAQLRKVEFYKGEEKIGEKTIAPFTFEYDVKEVIPDQQLSFYAVLTDMAGNEVKSNLVTARVRVLPIRIEAENATLRGLARIAADPATRETSSNQAKVGSIDNPDSGIDLTIEILAPGEYLIRVAAGTGFDNTSHKIYIDDKIEDAQIYHIPNRGWNVWQTFDMVFTLDEGSRKISIRHHTWYGELDYVEYSKL